jgi:hypothetical protein
LEFGVWSLEFGVSEFGVSSRIVQNIIYHYDIQHVNHPLPLLPAAPSLAKEGSHRLVFIVKKAHISPPWRRIEPGKEGPGVVNESINH